MAKHIKKYTGAMSAFLLSIISKQTKVTAALPNVIFIVLLHNLRLNIIVKSLTCFLYMFTLV